jgi:hypothetical protein
MNQSGEAAEQIVRMSLEGVEVAARITGSGAKNVAALLYAVMKNNTKTSGKTHLNSMLKSGKPLKVFSIRQEDFKTFTQEAKRYGVLYAALVSKKSKVNDGIIDIMVREEDASKINRIVQRFKLAEYKDAVIRNEIEETRKSKEQSKGVQVKDKEVIIKEQEEGKMMKKEVNSLNPSLAKTEKSPLSEQSYEKKNYSKKGFSNKESVRKKLENYKEIIKEKDKVKEKSPKTKTPKLKKNKER